MFDYHYYSRHNAISLNVVLPFPIELSFWIVFRKEGVLWEVRTDNKPSAFHFEIQLISITLQYYIRSSDGTYAYKMLMLQHVFTFLFRGGPGKSVSVYTGDAFNQKTKPVRNSAMHKLA